MVVQFLYAERRTISMKKASLIETEKEDVKEQMAYNKQPWAISQLNTVKKL